jgi:hypothetical protein
MHVPTVVDEWFVRNCGGDKSSCAEVSPFCHHIIVAEKDCPSYLACHGMCEHEALITAWAAVRERGRREAQTDVDVVPEFVNG